MTIKEFAHKHHLRLHKDEDYTDIIPGKQGHIYEYDDELLGVMVIPVRDRIWAHMRTALTAAGAVVVQNGDEGAAAFDPNDLVQVKTALRAVQAKRIRKPRLVSPAQLEALRRMKQTSSRRGGKGQNASPQTFRGVNPHSLKDRS